MLRSGISAYLHSQGEHIFLAAFWRVTRIHLALFLTFLRQVSYSLVTLFCLPLGHWYCLSQKSQSLQYIAIYAFKALLHALFQLILAEASAAGVWHHHPFLIDVIKAQTDAVSDLGSHSKAKMEHILAPGSLTWGQYFKLCLSPGAHDLSGNLSACSWGNSFSFPLQLHPPPLCILAGLFLPGMITQKMGADSDRWTFPFSANMAMKSEPILMNVH